MTNDQFSNEFTMTKFTNNNQTYDLEERTAKFAESTIDLMKKLSSDSINKRMIEQLIGSAGSIGANYCEANGASSKKDFKNKIYTCKKEAKETKYWLRMLARAVEEIKTECQDLWKEAQEFTLIFSKIAYKS